MQRFHLLLALSLMLFALPALALDKETFTQERFDELRADGQLVLVDVYADWCSTCARQQEILKAYKQEHPDVDLHILEVNYDKDKQVVRDLRAPRQSTLLLYKGDKQHWFSVAETSKDAVFANINRAVDAK